MPRLPRPANWFARPRLPDRDPAEQRGVILLYHSVNRVPTDPWGLRVTPRHFASQMNMIAKHLRPMPLVDLHAASEAGALPRGAVAVTFDDGYVDNLVHAAPPLVRHNVPATVFVASGFIGSSREYWWDELDRILLSDRAVPTALLAEIAGTAFAFNFAAEPDPPMSVLRRWRAWQEPTSMRARAYRDVWAALRPLPSEQRDAHVEELRRWANLPEQGRQTHRMVTREELVALSRVRGMEIGAHTVTHCSLGSLPAVDQARELKSCRQALEDTIQKPVTSVSYPYGDRRDYNADTLRLARDAGYSRGCTNHGGTLGPGHDAFTLPRVVVADWEPAEFAARLSRWFGGG